ncbi:MAG: hypothetical protein COS88_00905, partial [Chloroflexi bacterium CG07_land_8_20_14_0_80_51_10]
STGRLGYRLIPSGRKGQGHERCRDHKPVRAPFLASIAGATERGTLKINSGRSVANQIEDPAKPVLDKIRSRQPMAVNNKETLSDYMVIMLKRVPKDLERITANFPAVLERVFANLNKEILRLIEEHPSEKDIFQERLQELPRLKLKYENEFPMELWYDTLTPDSLPRVRAILPAMTWVFLTSEKKQPFLTSDNPLFFFEGLGMGRPESEITFPISSRIALWATWRKDLRESYIPAKDAAIKEINRRTASAATKYVYYSEETQWVVDLINKKNVRLNRLK